MLCCGPYGVVILMCLITFRSIRAVLCNHHPGWRLIPVLANAFDGLSSAIGVRWLLCR